VLLFVFWYCHKRGREVRIDKEAALAASAPASEEDDEVESESEIEDTSGIQPLRKDDVPASTETGGATTHDPSEVAEKMPSVQDLPDPSSEISAEGKPKEALLEAK